MERSGFYLKTAADGDAEQIHALMRDVYDGLEDKSLYGCDDLEFVRSHITKHGLCRHGLYLGRYARGGPDLQIPHGGGLAGQPGKLPLIGKVRLYAGENG